MNDVMTRKAILRKWIRLRKDFEVFCDIKNRGHMPYSLDGTLATTIDVIILFCFSRIREILTSISKKADFETTRYFRNTVILLNLALVIFYRNAEITTTPYISLPDVLFEHTPILNSQSFWISVGCIHLLLIATVLPILHRRRIEDNDMLDGTKMLDNTVKSFFNMAVLLTIGEIICYSVYALLINDFFQIFLTLNILLQESMVISMLYYLRLHPEKLE